MMRKIILVTCFSLLFITASIFVSGFMSGGKDLSGHEGIFIKYFIPAAKNAHAFDLGEILSGRKVDEKTIADYDKAIAQNPDDADIYYNRGSAWSEKGDFDKAIADYSKAIQMNPNYLNAYVNRANAWFKKSDMDKALADYDKAIQFNPDKARAYVGRGETYITKHDFKQGCRDLKKACELKDCELYNKSKSGGICD